MMVLTSCRRPVRHQTGCPTPMTASELFADIVGRSVGFHRFNAVVSTADGFVHLARANDLTIFSLQCEVGLIRSGFQPFIPVVCTQLIHQTASFTLSQAGFDGFWSPSLQVRLDGGSGWH